MKCACYYKNEMKAYFRTPFIIYESRKKVHMSTGLQILSKRAMAVPFVVHFPTSKPKQTNIFFLTHKLHYCVLNTTYNIASGLYLVCSIKELDFFAVSCTYVHKMIYEYEFI